MFALFYYFCFMRNTHTRARVRNISIFLSTHYTRIVIGVVVGKNHLFKRLHAPNVRKFYAGFFNEFQRNKNYL